MKTILILLLLPCVLSAQVYNFTRQINRTGHDVVTYDTLKVVITKDFITIGRDCYQVQKVAKNRYFLNEGAQLKKTAAGVFFWGKGFSFYYDRNIKKYGKNTSHSGN